MKIIALFLVVLVLPAMLFAGGPLIVSNSGVPALWSGGQVQYYTDQGNLSSLLPNAQADQFVADAWLRWTSVPLAQLSVVRSGQLDEDVNGGNVNLSAGVVSFPGDVKPASSKPLAIVYDADGAVINALLGSGAGARELCSTNSVYSQIDRVELGTEIAHAIVVINGNCAQASTDLPILRYHLVRTFGRILGLDYSQLNENVISGSPAPSMDDYAGYPVMHAMGALCSDGYGCVYNADVPRMDDRAALARLYPATGFGTSTARIRGVVRFPAWRGFAGQGMQGVNVVARLVDPTSGRPSHLYTASSVSGFLFRGNAGNPITGYLNLLGQRWDDHGSADTELEGYFDLAGLEVPDGYNTVQYEVSIESLNPVYNGSTSVGPYVTGQVAMSGAAIAHRIAVSRGAEATHDFTVIGGATDQFDAWESSSFARPRVVPLAGSWIASLSGYGDTDYLTFHAEAGRTFTMDVRALDETNSAAVNKALPVVGLWQQGDPESAPSLVESYFNAAATATTRMQASVIAAGDVKIGIADYRGDGRPDFRYSARLFYGDKLDPARVSVAGGAVVKLNGYGFSKTTQVSLNGAPIATTLASANQIVFTAPALSDGTYTLLLTDSATGSISQMNNALVAGSAGAKLVLLNGANPQVPVGAQAPNPIRVQVLDVATGVPVSGATVRFAGPSSVMFSDCGRSSCTIISDQSGIASVQVVVNQAGASVIAASLPTGGSVSATVNGVAASLEITVKTPVVYILSGATINVPVSALVVQNGAPATNRTVNFLLNYGSATITTPSSLTGADGFASSAVEVTGISSDVNISACVAPVNSPCRTLLIHPVASDTLTLRRVSGDRQVAAVGSSFSAVVLQVNDAAGNPVLGAPVIFDIHVFRSAIDATPLSQGEVVTNRTGAPVVISSAVVTLASDTAGLASVNGISLPAQPVDVMIRASAGTAAIDLRLSSMWPITVNVGASSSANSIVRPSVKLSRAELAN
jgi:hypothetical protein